MRWQVIGETIRAIVIGGRGNNLFLNTLKKQSDFKVFKKMLLTREKIYVEISEW